MFKVEFKNDALLSFDSNDVTMNDAIQTIYSFEEDLVLYFGGEKTTLSMKYDVGDSWPDIINMMNNLKEDKDFFYMQWPSQSYWVLWTFFKINEEDIKIESNDVLVFSIVLKRNEFIKEWQRIIDKVHNDLIKQGYLIEKLNVI